MNLGLHIFNFLQENKKAELPGFGVFTLTKKSAILDEATAKLLPPSQEITFAENKTLFNSILSKYIAEKEEENLFLAQTKIKDEVDRWKNDLSENKTLHVENLGTFYLNEGVITLHEEKDITKNPQFFGLEEIKLEEIKTSKFTSETTEDTENQYVFNYSILWIFLLILPIGGLLYLALNYPDKIFGKKSFDMSVKTSTQRIEKEAVIDSSKVKSDSLQKSK
jgi:nucleoid DNA-binding protein